MWKYVAGINKEGRRFEPKFDELGGDVKRTEIFDATRKLLRGSPARQVLGTIEEEFRSEDPLPGIDPIARWGEEAAALVGPPEAFSLGLLFGQPREPWRFYHYLRRDLPKKPRSYPIDQALIWTDQREDSAEFDYATVWNEPYILIVDVSGLANLTLHGLPSSYKDSNGKQLIAPEAVLEWRGYFGSNTLIVEGETKISSKDNDPRKLSEARLSLFSETGVLIGWVVRGFACKKKMPRDPSFRSRLRKREKEMPGIKDKYLELKEVSIKKLAPALDPPPEPGPTLVIIHGAFSSCVPILLNLDPLRSQTYRYEHDTFVSIAENGDDLFDTVNSNLDYLKPNPLHLIAHSRGGLVARYAARKLKKKCPVIVQTYGTPHIGTPIADLGASAFNALISSGRIAVGGVSSIDPVTYAFRLLLRPNKLPPGLDVMRTDSEALRLFGNANDEYKLLSYGGKYDFKSLPNGGTLSLPSRIKAAARNLTIHAISGFFEEMDNDLVVPTSSALAAGEAFELPVSCSHSQYFCLAEIVEKLRGL